MPQTQSGVTALRDAFFAKVNPAGDGEAAKEASFLTWLPAASEATVGASIAGGVLHLSFGLPAGAQGEQGGSGEVTTAQLETAIGGTARNPVGLDPLSLPTSDAIHLMTQDYINNAFAALRRS